MKYHVSVFLQVFDPSDDPSTREAASQSSAAIRWKRIRKKAPDDHGLDTRKRLTSRRL